MAKLSISHFRTYFQHFFSYQPEYRRKRDFVTKAIILWVDGDENRWKKDGLKEEGHSPRA